MVFIYFVCISEQIAIISPYNINWLVLSSKSVYCAVRTECVYVICHVWCLRVS
jgi:hypothetical protein